MMRWLDDLGDTIGPFGCLVFLVVYCVGAVVFLTNCSC